MNNTEKKPLGFAAKLKSNKFKHGTLATVFTVVFIVLIIVLNVVVTALTARFPSMNIDLTAQKLNTLSETAVETAKDVKNKTEIVFIGSEEAIMGDRVYADYGLKYSQAANLAAKMSEANSNITVKFVDPDTDPAFVAQYPDDGLSTGTILVKTDARYRVLTVVDLFSIQQDQQTGARKSYSLVDGALSNAVYLTNLEKIPVVAVATGHNEMLVADSRTAFDKLMTDNALQVTEFNLLTGEIPAEAQLLMLPTPDTDYTKEEIAKLQAFLSDTAGGETRSVLVTCHPTQGTLPNLATFLEDWGVKVGKGLVMESDQNNALSNNPSYFFANSTKDVFPDNTYSKLLSTYSSPLELTFKSNNDITTYPLIQTNDTAYVVLDEQIQENPETSVQTIASVSQRVVTVENAPVRSNVIVLGNTVSMLPDFLNNTVFGNRQYTTDLIKYATGTTDTGMGLSITPTETNTIDITATAAVVHFIGLILCTILIPIAILIAGLVIFLRRRHL